MRRNYEPIHLENATSEIEEGYKNGKSTFSTRIKSEDDLLYIDFRFDCNITIGRNGEARITVFKINRPPVKYFKISDLCTLDELTYGATYDLREKDRDFNLVVPESILSSKPITRYIDLSGNNNSEITNFFVEDVRLLASKTFRGHEDMILGFAKEDKFGVEILKRCIIPTLGRKDYWNEQISILEDNHMNIVSTFPYGTCKFVYDEYRPKRVLDMCAGWGDRLISALYHPDVEEYTGIDPSTPMEHIYEKIVDEIDVDKDKSIFKVYRSAFEDFDEKSLKKGHYDLMFTSPPYMNVEKYSDDQNAIYMRYSDSEQFVEGFFVPSFEKINYLLADGGHMAMVISDRKNAHYLELMFQKADKYFEYLECVPYVNGNINQPIFFFRKR